MKSFLEYLAQKTSEKKLVVYDFDGTLFHSPDKEHGEKIYKSKTGKDWPYKGWWGRLETLMPPIVPHHPDPSWYLNDVVQSQKGHKSNPNTDVVLMTGRHIGFKERVHDLLEKMNIDFHDTYFYGQSGTGGSTTFETKANNIRKLMNNGYTSIEIYEDRPEHIQSFINFCREMKHIHPELKNAVIHDVVNKKDTTV